MSLLAKVKNCVKTFFHSTPNATAKQEILEGDAVCELFPDEHIVLSEPRLSQPSDDEKAGKSLPEMPSYIAAEVTNTCNLHCRHCNYRYGLEHYTRERGFMSDQLFDKIIAEISGKNIGLLLNYDGEPLMHPHYMEFLRKTQEANINTYFNTNGTLLNKKFVDEFLTFFRGSVFCSMDGDKTWFEKIRTPANYEQVHDNIMYLIKENDRKGHPVTIGISFCNFEQSAKDRRAFVDKWLPLVNYVSIGETNDKFGTRISNPIIKFKLKSRPVCIVPWQTCGICHNGDVIPCSMHVTRANTTGAIFGNLHNQTLKEIWNSDKFNSFRKTVASLQLENTFCEKCERWMSQLSFPDEESNDTIIRRNGYWITFQNKKFGSLNFM